MVRVLSGAAWRWSASFWSAGRPDVTVQVGGACRWPPPVLASVREAVKDDLGRCEVLHAQPDELADGDLVVPLTARCRAGEDLAEFRKVLEGRCGPGEVSVGEGEGTAVRPRSGRHGGDKSGTARPWPGRRLRRR